MDDQVIAMRAQLVTTGFAGRRSTATPRPWATASWVGTASGAVVALGLHT